MAGQQRLVNNQFNSPIGLYSDANVREIIERESQMLANGAIGINFNSPTAGKPSNLQNSAVLRMLEEEESRQRNGQSHGFRSDGKPLLRAWPPPGVNNRQRRFQDRVVSGVKRVAWPPPREGEDEFLEQEAVQTQGGPQYSTQSNNNPQVQRASGPSPVNQRSNTPNWQQQQQQPQNFNSQQTLLLQQVPQQQQQQQPQPTPILGQSTIRPSSPQPYNQFQQQQGQNWAPVPNQVTSPKPYQNQPQYPSPQQQQIQQQQQQQQPQLQQQQSYQAPAKAFEPPPTTITLRPSVPISQAPAPIVQSQPATATLKGGRNLRGDLKWPPENVKTRMENEKQMLEELAKGPACKPKRPQKDYSGFFAQHALNSAYPGYKIPPGTQFYEHHPVM